MTEVEGERGLRVAAAPHVDAGGGPTQRVPSFGADCQPRRQRGAAVAADGHLPIGDFDYDRFIFDTPKRGKFAGARFQRGDEKPISDVVTKSIEADLARGKANFRRAHQPRRVVDDPHHPKRRGMLAAKLPDPQRVERLDRPFEQGAGANI